MKSINEVYAKMALKECKAGDPKKKVSKKVGRIGMCWGLNNDGHAVNYARDLSNVQPGSSDIVFGTDMANGPDKAAVCFGVKFVSTDNLSTNLRIVNWLVGEAADDLIELFINLYSVDLRVTSILDKAILYNIYHANIDYPESVSDFMVTLRMAINDWFILDGVGNDSYEVCLLNSDISNFYDTLILKQDLDDIRLLMATDYDAETNLARAVGMRLEAVGKNGLHYLITKSNSYRDSHGEKRNIRPWVANREAEIVLNIFTRFGLSYGPVNVHVLMKALSVNISQEVAVYYSSRPEIAHEKADSLSIISSFFGALLLIVDEFDLLNREEKRNEINQENNQEANTM